MPRDRREHARLADDSLRFRWPGARREEPVVNLSRSGAKLRTIRSAPVGSSVELEILRPGFPLLEVMATVRRVERPTRRSQQGGSGDEMRLGLAVEFLGLGDEQLQVLDGLIAAGGAAPQGEPARSAGAGRDGEASESAAAETGADGVSSKELKARLARAESLAAEAIDKLAQAQRRIAELESEPESGEAPVMVDAVGSREEGEQSRDRQPGRSVRDEAERGPISGAVKAFGNATESPLATRAFDRERLMAEVDSAAEAERQDDESTVDPPSADRAANAERTDGSPATPTSGVSRSPGSGSFAEAVSGEERRPPPSGAPPVDVREGTVPAGGENEDDARSAFEETDPEPPPARSPGVTPPAEATSEEEGSDAEEEASSAFEEVELGASPPPSETPDSASQVTPPEAPVAEAPVPETGAEVGSEEEPSQDAFAPPAGWSPSEEEPTSELPWPEPEEAKAREARSSRSRGRAVSESLVEEMEDEPEEGAAEREEVVAAAEEEDGLAALTPRDLEDVEGMVSAMADHLIERTARFARLEPVSRVDIQVSDWLRESETLKGLENRADGRMELDELHRVLWMFFQRGLIVLRPRT